MPCRSRIYFSLIVIGFLMLSLAAIRAKSSDSFTLTEKSRVEWIQTWNSITPMERSPKLVFQGENDYLEFYLTSDDKLLLQIIDLNDEGEFRAYLGVEGENPSGKLKNPRIVFERFQIPILVPLEANLTKDVESIGLLFHSSNSSAAFFESKVEINDTHIFKLLIGFLPEDHLLSYINATWYEKNAPEVPVLEFSLSDPIIQERYSEVSEPIEWIASAFLLILGLGIILFTKIRRERDMIK
ncbi:MAG: hypothetical protein ACFFB3_08195 [Candidatus Hodarchaeota archaeon]